MKGPILHNDIRAFHLEGQIDDTKIEQTKERLIHFLKDQMRVDGYVEVLDIDPQFSMKFDAETGEFIYHLTLYGIEEADTTCAGYINGKPIIKYIPPTKSNVS